MNRFFPLFFLIFSLSLFGEPEELLDLCVVDHQDLVARDPVALEELREALHRHGVVGIRAVPGYRELYGRFIEASRRFSALPEEIKERSSPNRDLGETFLGYESGKEKFQLSSGEWVVDDLKASFYAKIPNCSENRWPEEVDLENPFSELAELLMATGERVMHEVGILGEVQGVEVEASGAVGRMLYYKNSARSQNPYWCGAHYDHGMFTAILPAVYFLHGERVEEPEEAGLFVRGAECEHFKKVAANDEDVMMFQVGEFGQIVSQDAIRATEHRVHRAVGAIERYTLALFFEGPAHTPILSTSSLTADERYGAEPGEPFTFAQWSQASFERYLVKE